MLTTERRQLGDPGRIVVETGKNVSGLDRGIKPGL
jgi:hypothetical protein